MTKKTNILAQPAPWDLVADGYAETTMAMLSAYGQEAIATANLDDSSRVLDVACGPGTVTLQLARQVASVHAIDFSAAMIKLCGQQAKAQNFANVFTHHGDGQKLPFTDESFDVAFSMFGLMFFPDRAAGFAEIYRTLKSGGQVHVSSWAPVNQSPAMQLMFEALRKINPDLPEPKTAIESLENPEVFENELKQAGFRDVTIKSVRKSFPVESVRSFWHDMVKGSAPVTMMKNSMAAAEWCEKELLALAYLHEVLPETPTSLTSDAWLGSGVK